MSPREIDPLRFMNAKVYTQAEMNAALTKAIADERERSDVEITRLQDGVRDHLIALGAPDCLIDGAGCDSGDPLDFTKAEITQAFNYFKETDNEPTIEARLVADADRDVH